MAYREWIIKISDIFSSYPSEKGFFSEVKEIQFFGKNVPSLCLEDTLIMLSAHGMKHFWPDMKSTVDIIQLLKRNPDINFYSLFKRAEKMRCRRLLLISLSLAHLLGGVSYSSAVQAAIEKDPVSIKTAQFLARMMQQLEPPDPYKRMRIMMRSREHLQDALGFGLYALFSWKPPEGCRIRLPRALKPLYFFLRPIF